MKKGVIAFKCKPGDGIETIAYGMITSARRSNKKVVATVSTIELTATPDSDAWEIVEFYRKKLEEMYKGKDAGEGKSNL